MKDTLTRLRNHPGRLQAVVVAAIALVTAFGISWSAEQVASATAFSAAVIALLFEPPEKVATAVNARRAPVSEEV